MHVYGVQKYSPDEAVCRGGMQMQLRTTHLCTQRGRGGQEVPSRGTHARQHVSNRQ